jgi:hypothetical protein
MEGSPFVGHGAFGILTKQGWVPDFGVYGIPEVWALWIGFQRFLRTQGSPLRRRLPRSWPRHAWGWVASPTCAHRHQSPHSLKLTHFGSCWVTCCASM